MTSQRDDDVWKKNASFKNRHIFFSLSLSLPLFPFFASTTTPGKRTPRKNNHHQNRKEEEKMAAPRRPRGPPLGVSSGERRRTAKKKKKKKKKKKDIKVEWSDHLLGVLEVQKIRFRFRKKRALFFIIALLLKSIVRTEEHIKLTRHDAPFFFFSFLCDDRTPCSRKSSAREMRFESTTTSKSRVVVTVKAFVKRWRRRRLWRRTNCRSIFESNRRCVRRRRTLSTRARKNS